MIPATQPSLPIKLVSTPALKLETSGSSTFYLYRDPKNEMLVLSYDGPSQPIGEAEDSISLLRDLGHMKNTGILIGTIQHLGHDPEIAHPTPLANHKVVAKNVANGTEYTVYTNEKGYFKFDLPVGKHDVTTAPEYGLRQAEYFGSMLGSVPVEKGTCSEHNFGVRQAADFKLQTEGIISGRLGSPDGKPFTVHPYLCRTILLRTTRGYR